MTRDIERWWVLYKLQESTDRHTEEYLSHEVIRAGGAVSDWKDGFVEWLADGSLVRWHWRPIKLWKYWLESWWESDIEKKKKLHAKFRAIRINFYNSVVGSCIVSNLIRATEENRKTYVRNTPAGDDFISNYWWRRTLGHPIMTAVIVALLIWFATYRLERLFKPQGGQVYQIQIVPYENK